MANKRRLQTIDTKPAYSLTANCARDATALLLVLIDASFSALDFGSAEEFRAIDVSALKPGHLVLFFRSSASTTDRARRFNVFIVELFPNFNRIVVVMTKSGVSAF